MNAADIMTHDVATVQEDSPLVDAVRLMVDRRISGVVVLDAHGRLTGMLTEGDLLRRTETGTQAEAGWLAAFLMPGHTAGRFVKAHGRRVAEIMHPGVLSVDETAPLEEVVALMQGKRVKRVPVMRGDRLVGVVSRSDVMRALLHAMQVPAIALPDGAIVSQIHAALAQTSWAPQGIRVSAVGGRVSLYGTLMADSDREAIRVVAENVPGVLSVQDHLVTVEPTSGMVFGPDIGGTFH